MSVEATNPETGVAETAIAPSDDIDTEAFDRVEAPDDADEAPADGEGDDGETEGKPKAAEDDEFIEVEHAGKKLKLPKEAEPLLMLQRDYTQKTQAHAEQVRQFAEEAKAAEARQAEAFAALRAEHVKVGLLETNHAALTKQAETYRNVDWAALQQQDPDAYDRHRAAQRQVRDTLLDLDEELKGARTDLSAKEAARLDSAAKAEAADLAKRQQDTGAALKAEIPGWSVEKATATAEVMISDFGVSREEIAEATDPRLWKMAHTLLETRADLAKAQAALKQKNTAANHERAQTTTPASTAKGTAGASARDPATPRGDKLSTEEWMRRRDAQVAAKRRA